METRPRFRSASPSGKDPPMKTRPLPATNPAPRPSILPTLLVAVALLMTDVPPVSAVVDLPDDFQDQLVVSGLNQPCSMAFLPDGRALLIEQKTRNIRLLVGGAIGSIDPILNIPDIQTAGNEQG